MKSPAETKNEHNTPQFFGEGGMRNMFQQMFEAMNEMLDHLIEVYPTATGDQKLQYDEQMATLKKMSDSLVEQWIEFEEKFSCFVEQQSGSPEVPTSKMTPPPSMAMESSTELGETQAASSSVPSVPETVKQTEKPEPAIAEEAYNAELDMEVPYEYAMMISKGQGYYKLFMFSDAATHFQSAVSTLPECNLARLYLAMTNMHLQNWSEAQRHFQLLISLTDYPKWRALGYNALGCIQAIYMNMEQAERFFLKAYETCPSFKDPLNNLKCCKETPQQLSLFFGSTELCCL
jgi:tetratricopeptide (TPR) repeat protein